METHEIVTTPDEILQNVAVAGLVLGLGYGILRLIISLSKVKF